MIPQLLQSLTVIARLMRDSCWAAGALVITVLAAGGTHPTELQRRKSLQPRILLLGALLVVGISIYPLQSFQSGYRLQPLCLGAPICRVLASLSSPARARFCGHLLTAELKPNENNKASSLTNFFRNWGGSFGIAFISTVSERRLSFHQERVGSNLPASSGSLQQQVQQAAAFLEQRGFAHADAMQAATAHFYNQLQAQAHLLGFMDCFHIIGIMTLVAAPLVLLTRSFKVGGGSGGGH